MTEEEVELQKHHRRLYVGHRLFVVYPLPLAHLITNSLAAEAEAQSSSA